jgi:hypothetical protein
MVEAGQVLQTWQLAEAPQAGRGVKAVPSFDHRLIYLEYDGPISGNRGTVRRWDAGTCTWEDCAGSLVFHLAGQHLQGIARLARGAGEEWIFVLDEPHLPTALKV